jgi:tetratricopeptide (TPR) repeat protein
MLTDSFLSQSSKAISLLDEAKDSFLEAIKRDKQNFKNYECLSGVYILLSELSQEPTKTELLNKAFDVESKAAQLYPGLDNLYFSLGEIAEHLGRKEAALENYKKAIEIEDAFRTNFKQMYPDLKVFSRLGEKKYAIAKQRVAKLAK